MQVLKHFEERPLSSEERQGAQRKSAVLVTFQVHAIAQCFTQQIILHGPDSSPPGLDG